MAFQKRPHVRNPRLWANATLAAAATALIIRQRSRPTIR
jgi:hypothetical protein